MGKKWFLIGGAAIIVVAVVLYAGLVVYPAAQFRTAIRQAQAFLPAGTSLQYKTAEYSLFSRRGILTGVTFRTARPHGPVVTSDRVVLDQPSLTLGSDWQRAEANPSARKPDAALPVADAIEFTNVVVHTPNVSEKIASARINGLHLYPWALLHPGVPTWADALAPLTSTPRPKSLTALLPLFRFEAAMALGVGYTNVDAHDIDVTAQIPPTRALPARTVTYRIAGSTGTSNERGIFDAGSAEHIVIALGPPAGTLTIDRFALSGLNLRQPLSQLLVAQKLTPALLNGFVIGQLELAGMSVKPPSRPAVTLGTFTLSKIAVSGGLPVSAALAWHGLRLTRAEMPDQKAQLAFDQLGLAAMTINFDAAYDWELQADRLSLQDLGLQVTELGSLSLSASLVGVTPNPDALDHARLAHATLRYTDDSLIDRAFKAAAANMHADPHAFRLQMIAMAQQRADAFANSPAIAEAAKAVIAFLQNPHSLTVELSPSSPVALAALRNASTMPPPDLATLLGLNVTANR